MRNAVTQKKFEASPQQTILRALGQHEWIFALLEPVVRSSLLSKLPITHFSSSTTLLSALYYRKIILPEIERPSSPKLVDFREETVRSFWMHALTVLNREARLGEVDTPWKKTLKEATGIISETIPENGKAFQDHISYICTVDTNEFRSASNPHFYGALFLAKTDDPRQLAVSIVHEMAHQELFLINLVDRLILSHSDFNLVHAPYQGVSRPPIGRLHSAHALFRMIPLERIIFPAAAERHEELLRKTIGSFEKGELTPFARIMMDEVY